MVSAAGTRTFRQSITSGFNVGDIMEFSGRILTSGMAGGMAVAVHLSDQLNSNYASLFDITLDVSGIFRLRAPVQAGQTTVRPRIINSAAGTGTFQLAQATLLNLTQLGLV